MATRTVGQKPSESIASMRDAGKLKAFTLTNIQLVGEITPYYTTFLPIFLVGCAIAAIAAIAAFVAGRMSGWVWPLALLAIGVIAFWVAIFFGADMGFRAWQSMPDPPPEAFSDASVVGMLVAGWVPGGMFCLTIFGLVRGLPWLLNRSNRDVEPSKLTSVTAHNETGNPYQGPNSR
jgi:hypothetical protein